MRNTGIYIHVPFCGKKCSYCDFYSVCYTKQQTELYVNAVLRNIRHYGSKDIKAETVYFGGGTPSLLTAEQISRILNEIKDSFTLADDAEKIRRLYTERYPIYTSSADVIFEVEGSPEHTAEKLLEKLK